MESLLDRDGFTLEELLDEDELIQECKSLNTRLINLYVNSTAAFAFWFKIVGH